jgi:hypothetical protein
LFCFFIFYLLFIFFCFLCFFCSVFFFLFCLFALFVVVLFCFDYHLNILLNQPLASIGGALFGVCLGDVINKAIVAISGVIKAAAMN